MNRRAFTLIEVMVATCVMSLVSIGTLASIWRLSAFAHEQAECLAADGYCHDVMWRFFNMSDEDLAKHGAKTYKVPAEVLPAMVHTADNGKVDVTSLLWRDPYDAATQPTCTVNVEPCDEQGSVLSDFAVASNALITVTFKWGRSDETDKVNTLSVVRAGNIDRWKNVVAD